VNEAIARIYGLFRMRCCAHKDGRRCQLRRYHDSLHCYSYWRLDWGSKHWSDTGLGEHPNADFVGERAEEESDG
jgi:hypothetical protein